eukprot:CAMPEP_0172322168 /NCGR_PEP_ID=MMETSP1058-20130122/45166_1 /TAXON_ID=83371 /ORGANISM="Detonula confervacea, Strain CCMP 353" /LENGTH=658 /DNA_ID=CAMNT_0013037829 /DNA_START=46 /DNA_END=2019 /DNA_ORIENTATION=+
MAMSPSPSLPPTPRAASIMLLAFSVVCSSSAFHAVPSPSILRNHHVSPTKASLRNISQPSSHHHHAASRSKQRLMGLSANNNDNMPSQEEIAQQKSEAYNALSSFHETSSLAQSSPSDQIKSLLQGLDTIGMGDDEEEQIKPDNWMCKTGAVTYTVPMDPAAGLKHGIISKPYKCSVQLEMDLGELRGGVKRRGLRLVESIQFGEDGDDLSMPFVRSIPLGANVDVDAVDGSYSLDDTVVADQVSVESPPLPLLPPSLLAGVDPMAVRFLVEHTLAVSETERCRCFLLYGHVVSDDTVTSNSDEEDEDDIGDEDFAIMAAKKAKKGLESDKKERNYRLLGVVLAEETKAMPEDQEQTSDDEEVDYASDFISQVIESPSPAQSPSSPLDLLEINPSESKDDKMDRLMQSLDKHNKQVMDSATDSGNDNGNTKMERHSLGMFGLTSGVWLGDTFVRESIPSMGQLSRARQSRQKGFGKKTATDNEIDDGKEEDRFATWHMGVQKVALLFAWDYSKSISQSYTYGKVMGTATSFSSMANIKSDGIVVVDQARRTKKREERRVVWDMDGGAYVAGLIGSNYFRAPRYMSFTQSRSYSADAYLTEFMVFYRPENDASQLNSSSNKSKPLDGEMEEDATPEYYCSRTSRLYNANDGSLMQGSTA